MNPKSFKKLDERIKEGNLRELKVYSDDNKVDFFSNDYLGLSKFNVDEKQTSFPKGSGGSRLISGNSKEAEELERFLAHFFGTSSALVFNSGYDANLGLFSSIGTRNDLIIYDELIHASMRDGIRLGVSKAFSFKHNDLIDLEKKIKLFKSKNPLSDIFVAVESLYSMDGDFAPLEEIALFCKKNKIFLIVDEAHSGGVFGKSGSGICSDLGINEFIFAKIITFGKAFGSHGAVVLGSNKLREFLINFARSFIYTTALPPKSYFGITNQFELLHSPLGEKNRKKLQENIKLFGTLNQKFIRYSSKESPIQILVFEDLETTKKVADKLLAAGFLVKTILSPTVRKGQERIRVCLHAFNSEEEIRKFSELVLDQI